MASMIPFGTPTGWTTLGEASEEQLEFVRNSGNRNKNVVLARRAMRAVASLKELKADLESLVPILQDDKRSEGKKKTKQPPVVVGPEQLQLVPFPLVSSSRTGGAKQTASNGSPGYEAAAKCARDLCDFLVSHLTPYKVAFKWLFRFAIYSPVLLLYAGMFYLMCAFFYLVANPHLFVVCFFSVLDAIPNYTAYATRSIAEQIKNEVAARLR